jgi:MFS family permease
MPNATSAVVVLLLRFTISQMDVPARNTYVAQVVAPDERSAAGGITSIVRSVGLGFSPLLAGHLLAHPKNKLLFGMPFIVAGGLKCLYDVLLYVAFKTSQPAAEFAQAQAQKSTAGGNYAQVGISHSDARIEHDTDLYDNEAGFEDERAPMRGK